MEKKKKTWWEHLLPEKRDDVECSPTTLWLIRVVAALILGILIGYLIWGADWQGAAERYQQRTQGQAAAGIEYPAEGER